MISGNPVSSGKAAAKQSERTTVERKRRQSDGAPYSSLSWHDHDLMNMAIQSPRKGQVSRSPSRAQMESQATRSESPQLLERRQSLKRQNAYKTQSSKEDPPRPILEPTSEHPTQQVISGKSTPDLDPDLQQEADLDLQRSVMEFVGVHGYDPKKVVPLNSVASSQTGTGGRSNRRASLVRGVVALTLDEDPNVNQSSEEKVSIGQSNVTESEQENVNPAEQQGLQESDYNANEIPVTNESKVEYIDTYSQVVKPIIKQPSSRRAKSALSYLDDTESLELRPKSAPFALFRRYGSSKSQRSAVRFSQPESDRSSEDLRLQMGVPPRPQAPAATPIVKDLVPSLPSSPIRVQNSGPAHQESQAITPREKKNVLASYVAAQEASSPQYFTYPPTHRSSSPGGTGHGRSSPQLVRSYMSLDGSCLVSHDQHRHKCYIPGRHTIDTHNAYSVTPGPHSHIKSLMGDPPCPRPGFQYHHGSAWYQIPGRYATIDQPVPPKRCQVVRRSKSVSSARSTNSDLRRSWHGPMTSENTSVITSIRLGQSASWTEGQFPRESRV